MQTAHRFIGHLRTPTQERPADDARQHLRADDASGTRSWRTHPRRGHRDSGLLWLAKARIQPSATHDQRAWRSWIAGCGRGRHWVRGHRSARVAVLATVASTSTLVPQEALWQFSLVGVGYVDGGLFACDRGAPVFGTTRNTVHVVCGVLEYVGAAAAFAVLSRDAVWASITPALSYATPVVLICWASAFRTRFAGSCSA